MARVGKAVALAVPLTILYLIYTGSWSLFEAVLGFIVSFIVGLLFADVVVHRPGKMYNPARWLWALVYAILYFTVIEMKAHAEVVKLILSPGKARPGIVRIPYSVETDYAVTTIANSITNTPGTVVVDIDEKEKKMYVHWIRILDETDEGARRHVSEVFERYAKRIFD